MDWSRPDSEIEDLSALAQAVHNDVDNEVQSIAGPFGPMIASGNPLKIGGIIVKALGASSKLKKVFTAWMNKGPKDVTVYIGYLKGKAVKTGISDNVPRREKQLGMDCADFATGLTRNQARAVETQIMKANPHFTHNKIFSISQIRDLAGLATEWAEGFIKSLGKGIKF